MFCKNSQRLNTIYYFCKKFHLRCSLGSEYVSNYCLWMCLWMRLCFSYYYFHFESRKFRRSSSQMSFKINVFKSFAIFTGKRLCWSLFLIKLLACKPGSLSKGDSNTGLFLWILQISKNSFFYRTPSVAVFKAMFETCQNFTMKNKKAFTKLLWFLYW